MKRVRMPMHRYGEPDFDRECLTWGFHDPETQIQEAQSILGLWITIDPDAGLITEKWGQFKPISLQDKMDILRRIGFSRVELRTMEGTLWTGDDGPYWLWVVSKK